MLKIEFSIATSEEARRAARITAAVAREWDDALMESGVAMERLRAEPDDAPATQGSFYLHPEFQALEAAPKRRGRPPGKAADPVAAYVQAGGVMPTGETYKTQTTGPFEPADLTAEVIPAADVADVIAEPPAAVVIAPSADPNREELLNKLRAMAQERGALWLREVFAATPKTSLMPDTAHPARKLSDLNNAAMAAILESV